MLLTILSRLASFWNKYRKGLRTLSDSSTELPNNSQNSSHKGLETKAGGLLAPQLYLHALAQRSRW